MNERRDPASRRDVHVSIPPRNRGDHANPRGAKTCRIRGELLAVRNPYGILFDALINTHANFRYGVALGGKL